jgi:hypothetical protein
VQFATEVVVIFERRAHHNLYSVSHPELWDFLMSSFKDNKVKQEHQKRSQLIHVTLAHC